MREESTVATHMLDWLGEHFPEEVQDAVQNDYYSGLKKSEKIVLDDLVSEHHGLLTINVGEWLLTDAKIKVREQVRPVRDLLLGPEGPDLTDVGRWWLSALGEFSLSLYEVQQVMPGDGFQLKDLLRPDNTVTWIPDRKLSRNVVQWDIFGARIVQGDEAFRLSGAVYLFPRETATTCKARILRKMKGVDPEGSEAREICCSLIATEWLRCQVKGAAVDENAASDTDNFPTGSVDAWFDEPQASLGDRTPLKAMKTTAGRRAVVELLKIY